MAIFGKLYGREGAAGTKPESRLAAFKRQAFRAYGKTLTWRAVAGADTFLLTLYATHDPVRAAQVVASENITKTFVLYPLHEAAWNRVPFGRKENGKETRLRSLTKAVSWRAVGTADTFLLSWLVTGQAHAAAFVATTELATKTGLYYFHERLWDHHNEKRRQKSEHTARQIFLGGIGWDRGGRIALRRAEKKGENCPEGLDAAAIRAERLHRARTQRISKQDRTPP